MMTEQEIIQYLKNNKDDGKGVPLGNMPEEVRKWIGRKFKPLEDILVMTHDMDWYPINEFLNLPFALSDNYETPQKLSGEWVEFEIREDGYFNSDIGLYLWFDWQKFLKFSYNQDIGFTAFGGWQYKDDPLYYMYPVVNFYENDPDQHCVPKHAQAYDCETDDVVEPAIPIKIRFWREYK